CRLGAKFSHRGDERLQNLHLALCRFIGSASLRLRIGRQRDRALRRATVVKCMPQFLSEKRHKGRQQTQRSFENGDQIVEGGAAGGFFGVSGAHAGGKPRLDDLYVPVAELAPEKLIDLAGRIVKAIGAERIVYLLRDAVEAREDPAVFQSFRMKIAQLHARWSATLKLAQIKDAGGLGAANVHE